MESKNCFKCGKIKPLTAFYKHPQMADGRVNKCKECNKAENRKNFWSKRQEKREYDLSRYRYDLKRLKYHKYKGIISRCEGGHKNRTYRVEGMKYLTKEQYEQWWLENIDTFLDCYKQWQSSGFQNKYAPSIDRIDNSKGYTPENMQWLIFTDNCSKYTK